MGNDISAIGLKLPRRTCSDKKKRCRPTTRISISQLSNDDENTNNTRNSPSPPVKQGVPATPQQYTKRNQRSIHAAHENLTASPQLVLGRLLKDKLRTSGSARESFEDQLLPPVASPVDCSASTPRSCLLSPDSAAAIAPANDRRNSYGSDRRRSKSLCNQQLSSTDLVALEQLSGQQPLLNQPGGDSGRKQSGGLIPSLARMRIQQGFKNATPHIGAQIIKRTAGSRPDIRMFLANLDDSVQAQLGKDLYAYIAKSVECADSVELLTTVSREFGARHVPLCNFGFKPEFFAAIADTAVAECVKLDGGVHKKCETMLAWSQLYGKMFTGVRDGYYASIRMQRRSSMPQYRQPLQKQNSFEEQVNNGTEQSVPQVEAVQ